MRIEFELTEFRARDVERITGVSLQMLRDWRRFGYLPKKSGHPKYSCIELLEVWVMGRLAEKGIGPSKSIEVARHSGIVATWFSLRHPMAYEGGAEYLEKVLPRMKQSFSESEILDMKRDFVPLRDGQTAEEWLEVLSQAPFGGRTQWLANEIVMGFQGEAPNRFVVLLSEDKWVPSDSLDSTSIGPNMDDDNFDCLVCLNLERFGWRLNHLAEMPLVKFEVFSEDEEE